MTHRVPLRADLIRDRNALYRELPGGIIENVYTLKITNMDTVAHAYLLTAEPAGPVEFDLSRPLQLGPAEVAGFAVRIRVPRGSGAGVTKLQLSLAAEDDPAIRRSIEARVLMPVAKE
jgi:polyferredoxin